MTLQHSVYEILAKEIAYVFDNPKFDEPVNEFLHTQGYTLNQSFNTPNIRFRAFGLLPIVAEKAPILVFRGTGRAIDDIASNHPKGIGYDHFVENQDAIATWLINTTQANRRKPDIIGNGLGGVISQIVATELIDWVGEVVTFSSPGTSRQIATQFLQNGGANLTVTHYIVDGDIISLAGEAFITGKVILLSFTDCVTKPLYSLDNYQRIGRLLSNPPCGFTQSKISVEALNHSTFTFFNPDYLDFLAAYYTINPEVTRCLTSRGNFEALRRSDFKGYVAKSS